MAETMEFCMKLGFYTQRREIVLFVLSTQILHWTELQRTGIKPRKSWTWHELVSSKMNLEVRVLEALRPVSR